MMILVALIYFDTLKCRTWKRKPYKVNLNPVAQIPWVTSTPQKNYTYLSPKITLHFKCNVKVHPLLLRQNMYENDIQIRIQVSPKNYYLNYYPTWVSQFCALFKTFDNIVEQQAFQNCFLTLTEVNSKGMTFGFHQSLLTQKAKVLSKHAIQTCPMKSE